MAGRRHVEGTCRHWATCQARRQVRLPVGLGSSADQLLHVTVAAILIGFYVADSL